MEANSLYPRRLGIIIVLVARALLVAADFDDCEDGFGHPIPNCRNRGRLIGTVIGVVFAILICSMACRHARRRRYFQGPIIPNSGPRNTQQTDQPPRARTTPPPYDLTYNPNPQAYFPTYISQSSYHQSTYHSSDPSLAEPRYHGVGPAYPTVTYSPYQPPPGPPPPPLPTLFEPPPPHPAHAGGSAPEVVTPSLPLPVHVPNESVETAPNPTATSVPQYPPPSYSA